MKTFLLFLLGIPSLSLSPAQVLFQNNDGDRPEGRTYDVLHYKLELAFDEARKEVHGTTHLTLKPLAAQISSVVLDAVGMNIHAVRSSSGLPVSFQNDSTSLTIHFDSPVTSHDTVTVSIQYSCSPEKGLHFIQPDSSDLTRRAQIWTQGQQSDNRHWFPSYDAPDDKATSEVIATVHGSYTVLSNGRLIAETVDTVNNTRTFHWRQEKPHSSYLIMIAAGEYSVIREEADTVPISHYVPAGETANGLVSFRNTRTILESLETLVNYPYPWEKYSQVVLEDFMWGGMENTSAVTLNRAYLHDQRAAIDFTSDAVIAHEIAHQWWGDLVTCTTWSHLWLHEGFANYYEGLYKRSAFGFDEHQYEAYQWAKAIRQLDATAGRKPIVSDESFSVNLYQRGAWVLRMLARLLGEQVLLDALTHFVRRYELKAVHTDDLLLTLEAFTGEDLRWFFQQWLYGTGYPSLGISTRWDEGNGLLRMTVTQNQVRDSLTGLFRFPLDIELTTPSGRDVREIWISQEEETFTFPVDEEPSMVLVDKGLSVLKSVDFPRTKAQYLFQLANASEGIDRLDACEGLSTLSDDEVFDALHTAARNDPFWAVRAKAINTLVDMEQGGMEMFAECYADADSRVRSAAIVALGKFPSEATASFLEQAAENDSSYVVLSACIRTLAGVDSTRGFELARRYSGMDSYRDMIRVASLNALRRLDDDRSVPVAMQFVGPSFETPTRLIAVDILADRGTTEARVAMANLARDPNTRIRIEAIRALGRWGGSESARILNERRSTEKDPDVLRIIEEAISGTGN